MSRNSLQIKRRSLFLLVLVISALLPSVSRSESLHEVIDREIGKHSGGTNTKQADDAEFLRRVYLDFAGKLPSPTEARKFLADNTPAKRENLIDQLLASNDYPRRMQEALTTMLLERRVDAKVPEPEWKSYMQDSFATNKPWDELVGELLFSEPGADKKQKPQAKFFLVSGRADMHQKTRDVARLFLGRDIMCAQCHNHPTVDDFTQAEYFGLFSYLQETPAKAKSEFESVFSPGKKVTGPRLPGSDEVKIPEFQKGKDEEAKKHRPRLLLSTALPKRDNELFVRNSVNRFWFLMMGRGLVDPLDMQHGDNPASHPELLDELAKQFAASGFNVKELLREIAVSKAYQRSSTLPDGVDEKDVSLQSYRTAIPKPLSPEQMAWAVMGASGNLEAFMKAPVPEKSEFSYKNYINGRIKESPNNFPDAMKLFVGVYGNPPGEAEVQFSPAMGHALFLMNEPLVLDWLTPKSGNLVDRLTKLSGSAEVADELYISVLTRKPSVEEQSEVREYLERFKNRRVDALGELAWALIASAEFRSNH